MREKNKILICLDEPLMEAIIASAEKKIVYASPSIHLPIAEAIVNRRKDNSRLSVTIIIDGNPASLRNGFGEIGGLKMLYDNGIDILSSPGLQIGVLIVDDRAWVFSPTAEVILEKPQPGVYNALNVSPSYTKWLLQALAPMENYRERIDEFLQGLSQTGFDDNANDTSDTNNGILGENIIGDEEVSDFSDPCSERAMAPILQPEIKAEILNFDQLTEIAANIDERPPRNFDEAREILVYNGYLQFVEMTFSGGRLAAKVIRLPDHLLNLVKDPEARVEIRAQCHLFEDIDSICPEIRRFEQNVNDVRRCYTQALGGDLGSVILTKNRKDFDKEIKDLSEELAELVKFMRAKLEKALNRNKERLIEIFTPLVLSYSNDLLREKWAGSYNPKAVVKEYVATILDQLLPDPVELLKKMDLRCTFKDVTWEMLNQKEFGDAIKEKFPDEAFTKLYKERNTIGERQKSERPRNIDDDWPEQIGNEPV